MRVRRGPAVAALGVVVMSMGVVAPASAAPATTEHGSITFDDEFDDPEVCAAEGFTVHVVQHETLQFHARGKDGQFLAGFAHHDISFEISANGKTIFEHDHYNNFFAPDGTSVAAGSQTHTLGEHGGIVLRDAGRIVFDPDGNPTFVAGPHPQFFGETWCAALMP